MLGHSANKWCQRVKIPGFWANLSLLTALVNRDRSHLETRQVADKTWAQAGTKAAYRPITEIINHRSLR